MPRLPPDVQRLRERDSDAWDHLYRSTNRRAYRVLFRITGAANCVLEELHQDVWLSAIESIEKFDAGRGTASDWILGIARFKGLTHLRKQYRRRVATVDRSEIPQEAEVAPDPIEAQERAAVLRSSLESLPENWQFVVKQKYEMEMSVKQIAELVETTPKAIESTLSRARQRLRELYRETIERPE